MGILYKVQELLADRISWVQYPDVRGPKLQVFKYEMPWPTRLFITVMSLITIGATSLALVVMLYLVYSVLS